MILAAATGTVLAQVPSPKPAVPAPRADPDMVTRPQPGVVRPPVTDPGMAVPPPRNGTATVIPPPGTPGNNPAIIPK